MSSSRTLIIGLDGATFDVIRPLAGQGHLPTLSRLMTEGTHGPLRAWPNMNSAAAWSSIVTGYNPGQHGIYHFGWAATPQRGQTFRPTTALDRRRDPFWRLLGAAGRRVGIINVPISYPADPVNSFMLAGMDTPDLESPGFAHPPELRKELQRVGIDYIIDVPQLSTISRRRPHEVPPRVRQMVDARGRAILHLMRTQPWDALMAVFVATDRMQHFYWPDERALIGGPEWAPLVSLYQQLDTFFARLLESLDGDTTLLVVSDHGSGPAREAMRGLNLVFHRLGLLAHREGAVRLRGRLLEHLLVMARKLVPLAVQRPLGRALPRIHLRALSESRLPGIDWSRTQAFASPQGWEIFINLRGREPEGTVALEDYDPLRDRLRNILLQLVDPISGRRAVLGVHRREDVFRGPHMDKAPDLLVEWDCEVVGDALHYPAEAGAFTVHPADARGPGEPWTGTHRPDGIFIAWGPHVRRGQRLDPIGLYDITPTILHLQEQPVPEDMDGRVLTEIFTEDYLRGHPVRRRERHDADPQEPVGELTPDEASQVEARLRALGYLE